jgi:hypothetical protein
MFFSTPDINMLRRAFHVMTSHVRSANVEKNLYHIRYVLPLQDDKIGHLKTIEITDDEIIVIVENPEITQWVKKPSTPTEPKPELKYHYLS